MPAQDTQDYVTLLIRTGMRLGELTGLTPEQITPRAIHLSNDTKTRKTRSIPISDDLFYPLLQRRIPFATSADLLRIHWNAAVKAAVYDDIRLHDLRHSFASFLAQDPTVPFGVIRDLLGHSTIQTTGRYTHLRVQEMQDAIKKLPDF